MNNTKLSREKSPNNKSSVNFKLNRAETARLTNDSKKISLKPPKYGYITNMLPKPVQNIDDILTIK